jgi:hypothetical protein
MGAVGALSLASLFAFAALADGVEQASSISPCQLIRSQAGAAANRTFTQCRFATFGNAASGFTVAPIAVAVPLVGCEPHANALNGKLVLLKRGTCSFGRKALLAEAAGAVGVMVFNDRDEPLQKAAKMRATPEEAAALKGGFPIVMVKQQDGHEMLSLVGAASGSNQDDDATSVPIMQILHAQNWTSKLVWHSYRDGRQYMGRGDFERALASFQTLLREWDSTKAIVPLSTLVGEDGPRGDKKIASKEMLSPWQVHAAMGEYIFHLHHLLLPSSPHHFSSPHLSPPLLSSPLTRTRPRRVPLPSLAHE